MPLQNIKPINSKTDKILPSKEEILIRLTSKLRIAESNIRIYPALLGSEYLIICSKCREEMTRVKTLIEKKLYESMIRYNTVRVNEIKQEVCLNREQVGTIIGEKLTKELSSPILHHFIHFQPSTHLIEGKVVLIQFLNKTDCNDDITAKKIAHLLNNEICRREPHHKIKTVLGQKKTLFVGYDNTEFSMIWTAYPELYNQYREKTIEMYKNQYQYRAHETKDTIYPSLFVAYSHQVTKQMLLAKNKKGGQFSVIHDLSFQPRKGGDEYYIKPAVTDANPDKSLKSYRINMKIYARRYQVDIPIAIKNHELILSKRAHEHWEAILTKELARPSKSVLAEIPFSAYTTVFGDFYIHIPEGRHAHEIAAHLNRDQTKAIFFLDAKTLPNIIYITRADYHGWLKKRHTALKDVKSHLSDYQQFHISSLIKYNYSPEIFYKPELIKQAIEYLEQSIINPQLLMRLKIGFQLKTDILNEAHFQDIDADTSDIKERRLQRKFTLKKQAKKLLESTLGESQYYYATENKILELTENVACIAEYVIKTKTCSMRELERLIRQFIYTINQKPCIRFDEVENIILLTTENYSLDLLKINTAGIEAHHRRHLAGMLTQIFCALADFVFYQAYIHISSMRVQAILAANTDKLLAPPSLKTISNKTRSTVQTPNNASEQLARTRPDIILNALSTRDNTVVLKSTIPNAQDGLFVIGPINLKRGQIISWFDGNIITEHDFTPDIAKSAVVSIEGYTSKNTQYIYCNKDKSNPGNAYYANHAVQACNASFQTIYYQTLPIGKVIRYDGPPLELASREDKIEILVNYGPVAAKSIHKISIPKPSIINESLTIKQEEPHSASSLKKETANDRKRKKHPPFFQPGVNNQNFNEIDLQEDPYQVDILEEQSAKRLHCN